MDTTAWLMLVSAAVAIFAGVTVVRGLVRWLSAKSFLIPVTTQGRAKKILATVGYIAALISFPFALFLGVTIGGTLGGGLGDRLVRYYGAAIGVGVGFGTVTLVITAAAVVLAMLLCGLIMRVMQAHSRARP